MKPHVTDEEYRQTEFIVQQFASGVGKELHKKLVEKASKERNWVRKTNKLRYPIHIGTLFSNLIRSMRIRKFKNHEKKNTKNINKCFDMCIYYDYACCSGHNYKPHL